MHYPLGATLTPDGTNFALYSQDASAVSLVLFDRADGPPTAVIPLGGPTRRIWHRFVRGVKAGQLYGYRVSGEHRPEAGRRFNEAKLLLDPYAKAVTGKFRNTDHLLLGYDPASEARDLSLDRRDNAAVVPKGIVVDDAFDWQDDASPPVPLEQLIVYEVHVKGFTAHPSAGVEHPGTYLGFIEKIPHLVALGVNAVELLPVHEFYVDDFLLARGLTNYWGYNSIGFFAPESSYSTGRAPGVQVTEFKTLVRALHRAGLKVILDVVYNHTGEGSELGPTLSFRGIDNRSYYSLSGPPDAPGRHYMNYTGCGNSLDVDSPVVLRLVMDSLRYWMEQMHVDGFRFDLASVLGRRALDGGFQPTAPFFDAVAQDPVLARAILIAEPWDLGTYQVGNFPIEWSEWNGRFRDTVRRFVKGDPGQVPDLARRVTGSADLYGDDGRSAFHGVNFVTCHDGFTLQDLVAYDAKHNEANGEDNRDGAGDNHSWNCGVEGPTDDPAVLTLRRRLARNHACVLLFAAGTPMILGGDEFLRTQRGNNNAYCQDNEISWFDWGAADDETDMQAFVRKAIALTRRFPILRRRKFLLGKDLDADRIADVTWFGADLGPPPWLDPELRTLCYQLDGGEELAAGRDYLLFLILHAHWEPRSILLPKLRTGRRWLRVVDTSLPPGEDVADPGREVPIDPSDHYVASGRSTVLLLGW
ncbi:MAG TPA: glycogen debranching protein GlgX [Methylomirabilota bacterium]